VPPAVQVREKLGINLCLNFGENLKLSKEGNILSIDIKN
jgi:hypothetical protein